MVDDEERLLDSIAQRISLLGHLPLKATSGPQALDIVQQTHVDLAIVDLKMPEMDGLVTITKLKEMIPDLKTILLTGYGNEKTKQATEALGSLYVEKDAMGGLWDIVKQSVNTGKVIVIKPPSAAAGSTMDNRVSDQVEIHDAQPGGQLYVTNTQRPGSETLSGETTLPKIIGETPEIQRLKKNIHRFSETDCDIIIKGEIGTGKELIARTIHSLSPRKKQKFIAFDCGCFSNDFQFKELVTMFNQSPDWKRPETHSTETAAPPFSGTIFLDHIENMPEQIQQEMLSLMDRKTKPAESLMDIRFIVVAHKNLKGEVSRGTFQKELYRWIQAIELTIPPLRERMEDLPLLCQYFLVQANREFSKSVKTIAGEVLRTLKLYDFPGNIRELKSIIHGAVLMADGNTITPAHLPETLTRGTVAIAPEDDAAFPTIQQMEQKHILRAINVTGGNKSKAAELLGISRAALWRKLRIMNEES